jgi:hypothetical protein
MDKQRIWRWALAIYLAGMLGAFVLRGIWSVEQNINPSAYDQRSYLRLGLNIVEDRDLSDGKRHPALPALLSLLAERDWPYYTGAKFLNLGIGVLCLILTFELGRRWFHSLVGAAAAGLLSINEPFLHVSSHVMAEPLLILLTLLCWFLAAKALEAPRSIAWRYAAAAGLMAGWLPDQGHRPATGALVCVRGRLAGAQTKGLVATPRGLGVRRTVAGGLAPLFLFKSARVP